MSEILQVAGKTLKTAVINMLKDLKESIMIMKREM